MSIVKKAAPALTFLAMFGLLYLGFSAIVDERPSTASNCEIQSIVYPEWHRGKDPIDVHTSCGVLYTKDASLAEYLVIGRSYSFGLRDVTMAQSTRRHIVKTIPE